MLFGGGDRGAGRARGLATDLKNDAGGDKNEGGGEAKDESAGGGLGGFGRGLRNDGRGGDGLSGRLWRVRRLGRYRSGCGRLRSGN